MKRLLFALLSSGLLFAACANPTSAPTALPTAVVQVASPTPEAGPPQRSLALVDSVTLAPVAAGATQAEAVVRGSLGDACTTLADVTVRRQAQVFLINIFKERPANAVCAQVVSNFERTVTLDLTGLAAGEYVVVANDVNATLTLPASDSAATATPTKAAPTAAPATTVAPTPTAAPTTAPPQAEANCINKVAFEADVTIPDDTPKRQGERFTKTWRVRNAGTCTWRGYSLVFYDGDQMSAPPTVPIPDVVPPDTLVNVSVELVAPTRGGRQHSDWQIQDAAGRQFGVGPAPTGALWAVIVVNFSGQEVVSPPAGQGVGIAPAPAGCGATGNPGFEAQTLALINDARAANGLPPYTLQGQLQQAAAGHAQDMACNLFIGHTGSNGTTAKIRAANTGFANHNSATENVYAGSGVTPDIAFNWWMNSEPHRSNILSQRATQIGVAYALSPRNGWGYYTLVFARP
jgi:uncharacterized protein YkwD